VVGRLLADNVADDAIHSYSHAALPFVASGKLILLPDGAALYWIVPGAIG
jgi:hypothetical protein